MSTDDLTELLGPALAGAFERQGYTTLTSVQRAVLAPASSGRDLRISSQTGSGKTLAVGFALRDVVADVAPARGPARPPALVVAPTRELAKQVEKELGWLFAPLGARVVSVIGGGNYRDERRALASGPAVVVGTPGRLLDHLNRGAVDASEVHAVVLDEADRMLDLGFREELEAILAFAPAGHRTHLVSATFPREVRALADRVQTDPVHVEGTKLGEANTDIEHLIHLVLPKERVDAIVNLLLSTPGAAALVFVKTRADVGDVAEALGAAGFRVSSLSGEMEQPERTRALAAFKRGALDALVATDVAARGLDVDVARVIHAEPPTDADAYTHRSGRTGRAGKKGTSSVLVTPTALPRTVALLRRAAVRFKLEPVPTAASIRAARDDRLFVELTGDRDAADGAEGEVDASASALAKRICEGGHAERALERLLSRSRAARPRAAAEPEPREVTPLEPKPLRPAREADQGRAPPTRERPRPERPHPERPPAQRSTTERAPTTAPPGWVSFRVSWGQAHGADTRRLLAMMCRRGNIRGSDVGTIRVARSYSVVDIAAPVAESFARAAAPPDPRDPRVIIRPVDERGAPPPAKRSAPRRPR